MVINTLFNETELAMFQRQTGFTFGEFFKTADGVLFAVDSQSGQVFIGRDLLKANVHELESISSFSQEEDGVVVAFKSASAVKINASREDAVAFIAQLGDISGDAVQGCLSEEGQAPHGNQAEHVDESADVLRSEELAEFYSRLENTGRSQAIGYLVSETGMSVEDACKYVDEIAGQGSIEEPEPEADTDPDYRRDGTMTKKAILDTVKKLRPGDRIHLEFKPLIGSLRVYDTEYRKLRVDTWGSRYFSLTFSADDYTSLMDSAAEDLFDYIDLYFFCEENSSEISCHLKRVTILKITNA